jgi:hypothetical protein
LTQNTKGRLLWQFRVTCLIFVPWSEDHHLEVQEVKRSVVAAMRTSLHLIYGALKSGKPFDPALTLAA